MIMQTARARREDIANARKNSNESSHQRASPNQDTDMTKLKRACVLFVSAVLTLATNTTRADQAEDEAAIRKSDEAYVAAYNNLDAKAIAGMWSPEAVYVDPETGEEAVGREEIEKEFADTFS